MKIVGCDLQPESLMDGSLTPCSLIKCQRAIFHLRHSRIVDLSSAEPSIPDSPIDEPSSMQCAEELQF
jgi:hypothetical protein